MAKTLEPAKFEKLEIASFCSQIAMLLKSGVTVAEALSIIGDDLPAGEVRDVIETMHQHTLLGGTFTEALQDSNMFPGYVVNMARVGEASGRLDECLDALSNYYEREDAISKSIRSAVTYPLVMVAMMLLVVGVLVVKVLPIFNRVYTQLGAEMTGVAASLLNFGSLLGSISIWLIGLVAVLVVAFFVMRTTAGGRATLEKLGNNIVFTRKLNEKIAAGRFASGMALMLKSGLNADQALETVEALVAGQPLAEKVAECRKLTGEGMALAEALAQTEIFTGVYARMVAVGFKTGAIDEVMGKIALRYEDEVDVMLSGIIAVLEPTLVAVLSVLVGMILLSVMLPLMGVMASIG